MATFRTLPSRSGLDGRRGRVQRSLRAHRRLRTILLLSLVSAMLPEENSGRAEHQVPRVTDTDSVSLHETPAQPFSDALLRSAIASLRGTPDALGGLPETRRRGLSQVDAARQLGVSNTKLSRMAKQVAAHGLDGLKDRYHNCGRNPSLTFTDEEFARLGALYLKTNRTADAGSMQTACKFFALRPANARGNQDRDSFFSGARPPSTFRDARIEADHPRALRRASQSWIARRRSFLRPPWNFRQRQDRAPSRG
jgi:hypothetical protein